MRVLYGWGSAGIKKGLAAALLALFASMIATSVAAEAPATNEGLSAGSAVTITTTSLPAGVVGASYAAQLKATGGNGRYAFSYTGKLPPGINFDPNGSFSGTPTKAGSHSLTFTATEISRFKQKSKPVTLTLTVDSAVAVTTPSLGQGTLGEAYSLTLKASGGIGPYTFTATGLPKDLSLNGDVISGTPAVAGAFSDYHHRDRQPGGHGTEDSYPNGESSGHHRDNVLASKREL